MFTPWLEALGSGIPLLRTISRARVFAVAVLALVLSACGGGGGSSDSSGANGGAGTGVTTPPPSSNVSLSVSPLSVTVSASTAQTAPTASVQLAVNGLLASQGVYITVSFSKHGISAVDDASGSSPIPVTIEFLSPGTLGAGVYTDTVTLSACYDKACTQQVTNSPQTVQVQYTVTAPVVQLSSLSPATALASGPAFTLTVNGSKFSAQDSVQWNGSTRNTTFVSATQLTAQITAADIATAGSAAVTVNDPANGLSNPLPFTIQAPQLSLIKISPTRVSVGGSGFNLTVLGTGFSTASTVEWNGTFLATTYVSTSELTAQVTAADIASLGTASVTVIDPSSSVGTTSAQALTIAPVSIDAVAFQIDPAHTGGVSFSNITLPTSGAAWSVDVGGTPSYALIASGKVFVTVDLGSAGSQLVALDQATGTTVWGPIAIGGRSNAAYDSGKVFVLSSRIGSAATLLAYDAQTGNPLWNTLLNGQYAFSAAPTAANGLVYTGGAGSGGTLYAVDQSNGNLVWTAGVANGDDSTPAVTNDGVYVSYPCQTYNFRPATGESIWQLNGGCDGGGGATPVVANQLVYSPTDYPNYSGNVDDAETGATAGTFTASAPPAFMAGTGYFLQSGTLRAITQSNSTVKWSFAGDGQLAGSPLAVGAYVFIGSASGNLYALNGATGQQVWQVTLPDPVVAAPNGLPYSGLSAGDGLLVVPAGTKVNAFVLSTNP